MEDNYIKPIGETLQDKINWLHKELFEEKERNKKLERQVKIKNAYLALINDIAYDYDGCNTVESLKELIDELVKMNTQALKNDDWTVMYTDLSQTKNRNILQELLDERNNTDEN